MRCVFCKQESSNSKSVEHIIPESLGNKEHVLPVGIVCDTCNNYFARKVEKPFLDLLPINQVRFRQLIANKKGNMPAIDALLNYGYRASLQRDKYSPHLISLSTNDEGIESLITQGKGVLHIPIGLSEHMRHTTTVSRFLAKCAVEVLVSRFTMIPNGINEGVIDQHQLDPIRNHARQGVPAQWKYSVRHIYDENFAWVEDEQYYQVLHEYMILVTDRMEFYFILAIFGLEFAINIGESEVDGYHKWLKEHNHLSPLYQDNK